MGSTLAGVRQSCSYTVRRVVLQVRVGAFRWGLTVHCVFVWPCRPVCLCLWARQRLWSRAGGDTDATTARTRSGTTAPGSGRLKAACCRFTATRNQSSCSPPPASRRLLASRACCRCISGCHFSAGRRTPSGAGPCSCWRWPVCPWLPACNTHSLWCSLRHCWLLAVV